MTRNATEGWLEAHRVFARSAREPAWLARRRETAMERFAKTGFPTTKNEDWRFTNVAPIRDTPFREPGPERIRLAEASVRPFTIPNHAAPRLVLVNGRFAPELSSLAVPKGVSVRNLEDALQKDPETLRAGLESDRGGSAFEALNAGLFRDGAVVTVEPGAVVRQPIHVLHMTVAEAEPVAAHPRIVIDVGGGAEATIVESYAGTNGGLTLTNAVTQLAVGDAARLDHYKVNEEPETSYHIAAIDARMGRDARYTSHNICIGGGLVRNDLRVVLDGEGANCMLNGLFTPAGSQLIDNHTTIDHAKPRGTSRELYKGILGGKARGVFNGRILVRPGAQKTDAMQSSRNLLLSDEALVESNPQLEIYADDVRCTHGSTIGQLDDDAVFYLRARGLDEATARGLLIHAFAAQVTGRMGLAALRKRLERTILDRLPGAAPEGGPA